MNLVVIGTRGIPYIMGGVETHCEELFPRIVEKGINVTVFRRKNYVHDNLTKWNGVKLIDIKTPKKKSFESIIHTFKAILKAKAIKDRSCIVSSYSQIAWYESCIYSPRDGL